MENFNFCEFIPQHPHIPLSKENWSTITLNFLKYVLDVSGTTLAVSVPTLQARPLAWRSRSEYHPKRWQTSRRTFCKIFIGR